MTNTTQNTTQAATAEVEAYRSPLRDMTDMLSDLVSIAEISARINKSQPNVHQMLNGKAAPDHIEGPNLGQRGKLYSWAEVEDFLNRKAEARAASIQRTLDAAEKAQKRAEKAAAKAAEAKRKFEEKKAEAERKRLEAEAKAEVEANAEEDVEAEEVQETAPAETLDLGDDWEDVEVEEDEDAKAAALADMEDEDDA